MDEILQILSEDARVSAEDIAKMTGRSKSSVEKAIKKYEKEGVIVKYKTVINTDRLSSESAPVRALIEVSIDPQREMGFDHVAERIYAFPEVKSCYLVSGAYDLLVVVEGESLQTVANFISSKLSPLAHVRNTTTHFLLKKYKEDGYVFKKRGSRRRLAISY